MAEFTTNTPAGKADRGNHFLLIVDGDADNLFYTSTLLKRFAYQTFNARTAKLALEISAVAVPTLVITTLDLKDISGLELIRLLGKNANTAHVPLIVLKNPNEDIGNEFEDPGISCLLDKPVAPELLYQAVQKATETRPRSCIRVRKLLPVKVNDERVDCPVDMCAIDLSERGMFLRTSAPAAKKLRLSLRLYLNGRVIPAEAEVVYCDRTGTGPYGEPGMGLKFVAMTAHNQGHIQQFIRSEVMRGIAPVSITAES